MVFEFEGKKYSTASKHHANLRFCVPFLHVSNETHVAAYYKFTAHSTCHAILYRSHGDNTASVEHHCLYWNLLPSERFSTYT
ncbi:unnamed protein product [Dicrocoelium dendriticum]|nr:unnamed protein product [Dicrocoelium dendriticum]